MTQKMLLAQSHKESLAHSMPHQAQQGLLETRGLVM